MITSTVPATAAGAMSPRRLLRRYSLAMFASSAATGLWLSGGVIFLTRFAHLPVGTVGLVLSVTGVAGLAAGVPIGAAADRLGPRNVAVVSLLLQIPASLGFLLASTPALFFLAALTQSVALAGSTAARGGLLAGLFGPADAPRARNTQRAVSNAAVATGSGVGGLVLVADSAPAYVGLLVGMAVAHLLAAMVFATLPEARTRRQGPAAQTADSPLRDVRYLVATALNGLMNVQYPVLTIAVPLWIVSGTDTPVWVFSILMVVNTTMCVLLQVRVGRKITDTASSAAAQRRSTYLFILACALFATASGPPARWAVVILVVAVIVHTFGELLQASSSFTLSFTLARDGAHGQYQGIWGIGSGLGQRATPVFLTGALAVGHTWAWAMIAVLFLGAGMITNPVLRWAGRTDGVTR